MKKNIYIDITNLILSPRITGIQRVVIEVISRMIKLDNENIVLLKNNDTDENFTIINNESFINYYYNKVEEYKNKLFTRYKCYISDITEGNIFLDIDSSWNHTIKRSNLLPRLKIQRAIVGVLIYDIIPIMFPQYSHYETVNNFMDYIGAHIQYSDFIITNTYNTKKDISNLCKYLGVTNKKIEIMPLGSNFSINNKETTEEIDNDVIKIAEKCKYLLCVGTIEPRKNHEFLLNAFTEGISELNINLIIVGKQGWNVNKTIEEINKHSLNGKKLFYLKNVNDITLDYLYKNAFFVVFPSFYEGYGLPIIEAIERGTPVLASDVDVLKEVGKEFCDYFKLDDIDELCNLVKYYSDNLLDYEIKKNNLSNYKSISWDEVVNNMCNIMQFYSKEMEPINLKQIVMLTARTNEFIETVKFIEYYMKFVDEIVVCCPNRISKKIQNNYKGNIKLKFIPDEDLLKGRPLPEDHQGRNFFLRCLAFQRDDIDEYFILFDDDYRPVTQIHQSDFIEDNKILAHYFYDLKNWKGKINNPTSFDLGAFRTRDFLLKNKLPTMQYSSHMPQAMQKSVWKEILNKWNDIINDAYCEWSIYFNYATSKYPHNYKIVPYKTMCWPGSPSDWDLYIEPSQILFENFYPELYNDGRIFQGFSDKFHDNIDRENYEKIFLALKQQHSHNEIKSINKALNKTTNFVKLEDTHGEIKVQDTIIIRKGLKNTYNLYFNIKNNTSKKFYISYSIHDKNLNFIRQSGDFVMNTNRTIGFIRIRSMEKCNNYILKVQLKNSKHMVINESITAMYVVEF